MSPPRVALQGERELADFLREQKEPFAIECGGHRDGIGASVGQIECIAKLQGLDTIPRFDAADLSIGVGAGLTYGEFQAKIFEAGLEFRPGPLPLAEDRSIGGLFSEAPPCPRAWDRGHWRSQLLGIRGYRADGRPFQAGGKVVKNVAGYDIGKLFTGGGGAYLVACELQLRLEKRPAMRRAFQTKALDLDAALELWLVLRREGIEAESLDLLLDDTGKAQVALVLAGPSSLVEDLALPLPKRGLVSCEVDALHEKSQPSISEEANKRAIHRGRVLPSRAAALLTMLPEGTVGRVHMQGDFVLEAALPLPSSEMDGLVLRTLHAPRAELQVSREPNGAALQLARRIKRACSAERLAPARASFDTSLEGA